jgi:hypothetical protein
MGDDQLDDESESSTPPIPSNLKNEFFGDQIARVILGIVFIALAAALLAGCDSPAGYTYQTRASITSPIPTNSSVYIGLVGDGGIDGKTAYGSGQLATTIICSVARSRFTNVFVGTQLRSTADNLTDAAALKCDYLFQTTITKWADHNTSWSGISDTADIELTAINVPTHEVMTVGTITCTGPVWTLRDGKPQDLLGPAVETYFKYLQGGKLPTQPIITPNPGIPSQK